MKISDLRIGDVIKLVNGKVVEVISLTILYGDTVGYRVNPHSPFEETVDISGVEKIIGRMDGDTTLDTHGKKTTNYWLMR